MEQSLKENGSMLQEHFRSRPQNSDSRLLSPCWAVPEVLKGNLRWQINCRTKEMPGNVKKVTSASQDLPCPFSMEHLTNNPINPAMQVHGSRQAAWHKTAISVWAQTSSRETQLGARGTEHCSMRMRVPQGHLFCPEFSIWKGILWIKMSNWY